jgi:DNA-binding CsgD family transcriptional regulator
MTNTNEQPAEYLAKVASGKRLQDVAKEEHVSLPTVRHHLNGLKASMRAETLPALVAKGIQKGVIIPDGEGGFKASDK